MMHDILLIALEMLINQSKLNAKLMKVDRALCNGPIQSFINSFISICSFYIMHINLNV